tara:strand:- start:322 stop:531 length:210 start_codon:yes stop_codon:yes gene_type:complete
MKIIRFIKWGFSDMHPSNIRLTLYILIGLLGLIFHSPYWLLGSLCVYWLDFTIEIVRDRWNEFERVENE